jgi:hypothetical protein
MRRESVARGKLRCYSIMDKILQQYERRNRQDYMQAGLYII